MDKKYEFTGETILFEGRTLRRIRYVRFVYPFTKKGSLGGWIEHEGNLTHEGNAVIENEAKVFDNAQVIGDSYVFENAIVKDHAILDESTGVGGDSVVGAETILHGSRILNFSKIFFYKTCRELPENLNLNHLEITEKDYGLPNIFYSTLTDTEIESTGIIINSDITERHLKGYLKIIHRRF